MRTLKLSPEEGFVLSRVDGSVSVKELVALTGLEEGRVVDIIGKLNAEGCIEVDDASPAPPSSSGLGLGSPRAPTSSQRMPAAAPTSSQRMAAAAPTSSQRMAAAPVSSQAPQAPQQAPVIAEPEAITNELLAFLSDAPPPPSSEDLLPVPDAEITGPQLEEVYDDEPSGDLPPASSSDPALSAAGERDAKEKADGEESETEEQLVQREARNEADYRKVFMTEYAQQSRDYRIKAALEVTGSDLLALCFDPDPQIIHAVLTNPHAGLNHARMIAFHHRTQIGLESVAKRMDFLKDSLVQRRLLRNPQLPTTILNRIMNPKMLMDVYKVSIDREIPERSRTMTREILRKKFMLASSDEKASLLFKTEGRCLILLVACTLDAHATTILCSKSNYTILFIQNLARWSATPPALLAHLLKLNVVRRNQGLAKMILKHPNTPADAKKNFIR